MKVEVFEKLEGNPIFQMRIFLGIFNIPFPPETSLNEEITIRNL